MGGRMRWMVLAGLLGGCSVPEKLEQDCFNRYDCLPGWACVGGVCQPSGGGADVGEDAGRRDADGEPDGAAPDAAGPDAAGPDAAGPDAAGPDAAPDPCGNGRLDPGEACDPGLPADLPACAAVDARYDGGTPRCTAACELDTRPCTPPPCGDGVLADGEVCDPSVLREVPCREIDPRFKSGLATCGDTCTPDLTGCQEVDACGDGSVDALEECDPGLLASWPCASHRPDLGGGEVLCSAQCEVQTDACQPERVCGNDVPEPGEECDDGNDVPGDGCSPLCTTEAAECPERPLGLSHAGPGFLSACHEPAVAGDHADAAWIGVRAAVHAPAGLAAEELVAGAGGLLAPHRIRLSIVARAELPAAALDAADPDGSARAWLRQAREAAPGQLPVLLAPLRAAGLASPQGVALRSDLPEPRAAFVLAHLLGHVAGLADTHTCPEAIVETPDRCDLTGDRVCDTPWDPGPPCAADTCREAGATDEVCGWADAGCALACSRGARPAPDNLLSVYPLLAGYGERCPAPGLSPGQEALLRCVLRTDQAAVTFPLCPDGEVGVEEACNSRDDDCDGRTDEGGPCEAGQACVEGRCEAAPPGGDDVFEDNDVPGDAAPLAPGAWDDLVVLADDEDWYRLEVEPGQRLAVILRFDGEAGDADLELQDQAGNVLRRSAGVGGAEVVHEAEADGAPRVFLVRVRLVSGERLPYRLEARVPGAPCD